MAFPSFTRTPEQLDAILRGGAGDLRETPYPLLLLALAVREKSAVLLLHRNQLLKEILFDAGSPVDCQSNIATETLARFLVSSGKLSAEDSQTALALSAARGVSLEEILTGLELVPQAELERMLQQSLGRKLLEPFSWKSGTFEISFDVPPPHPSAMRVKVPQLVLTGILKVETQESVDAELAFAKDRYLALAPEPLFDPDDVRLTADQQKILEAAREGQPLAALIADSGMDADDIHRIVYALLLLGVVIVTETPVRAAPMFELENPFARRTTEVALPPLPSPPAPSAASAVPPASPGVAPATAAEVSAAHQSLRGKDAFDLLEVGDSDGPLQFIRAFLRMAERFLPSKFDERAASGVRDKAQEVFLAAARAYAELADPVRRDALLATRALRNGSQDVAETTLIVPLPLPVPNDTPPAAVKPPERRPLQAAIIDPELLSRNGRELADAGKLREALSSFEMAAECDAQNGTYAAEVAWCRFRLQVSPAPATLKMLKNAIRIDPRSGLAHLYAGKVATALGNKNEASAFLNRAAMLMPRDLRVVEALKALR